MVFVLLLIWGTPDTTSGTTIIGEYSTKEACVEAATQTPIGPGNYRMLSQRFYFACIPKE